MSRHQPEHGADSPEARSPYFVLMEERFDGDRIKVRVPAAYGPNDARHQAEHDHPGYVGLSAEEVLMEASRDHQDAELQKAKDAA